MRELAQRPLLSPREKVSYRLFADARDREGMKFYMKEFVENIHRDKPDILIFMDKSARPAMWMFHFVWNKIYPTVPMPQVLFVNSGTEKVKLLDFHSEDRLYAGKYSAPDVQTLFVRAVKKNKALVRLLRNTFTLSDGSTPFENKKVQIVDEYSPTGGSLQLTHALFEEAFKDTRASFSPVTIFDDDVEPPWVKKERMFTVEDATTPWAFSSVRKPRGAVTPGMKRLRQEIRRLSQEIVDEWPPNNT